VRFSSRLKFLPRIRVHTPGLDPLTVLTVVMIVIFAAISRAGGVAAYPWPFQYFGVSWDGLSHGRFWQLLTYGLLHGNWFHLWVNVLMLWLVGGRVAHILGWRKWGKIVVLGVIAGGVLHGLTGAILVASGSVDTYLVGISGACFALLLALTTLSPESRMWPVRVSGKNLGLGVIVSELLLWLMSPELGVPGFSQMGGLMVEMGGAGLFQISHACHFGAAVVGWWYARKLLQSPPSLKKLQKDRVAREGV